jgi:hypothetical protein
VTGTLHPQPLDPEEELWFPCNWTSVLAANSETINSSTWTPSSEAVIDGQTKMTDEFTGKATSAKLTGGLPDTTYPWANTITTTDGTGHTYKRKRTILIQTVQK